MYVNIFILILIVKCSYLMVWRSLVNSKMLLDALFRNTEMHTKFMGDIFIHVSGQK